MVVGAVGGRTGFQRLKFFSIPELSTIVMTRNTEQVPAGRSKHGADQLMHREAFVQEAHASWVDYRETSLHLTLTEVAAWLDTWGTDKAGKPPECHG